MNLAAIPSPTTAVWHLGPIPIRAYALCIVAGIIVACVVTEVRMRRRGAPPWAVLDIAVWAVPFGIVGARIYHVITSPSAYFGAEGNVADAFMIWKGGLGIWGAVAGGALGAWFACRQLRIPLTFVADALAPGLPLAQAIGRLGNWFNNELYGGRTDLPWGLTIYQIDPTTGRAETDAEGNPISLGAYHPTFLYELLWNLGVALVVWLADRRFKLGKGRAFALYVMAYTAGRAWIEAMRTDTAVDVLGLRLNVWVSILVFLGALAYFLRVHGPQEYLLPTDDGDYRVVTEEEFAAGRTAQPASQTAAEETAGEAAEQGSPTDADHVSSADADADSSASPPSGSSDEAGVSAPEDPRPDPAHEPAPVEAKARDDA